MEGITQWLMNVLGPRLNFINDTATNWQNAMPQVSGSDIQANPDALVNIPNSSGKQARVGAEKLLQAKMQQDALRTQSNQQSSYQNAMLKQNYIEMLLRGLMSGMGGSGARASAAAPQRQVTGGGIIGDPNDWRSNATHDSPGFKPSESHLLTNTDFGKDNWYTAQNAAPWLNKPNTNPTTPEEAGDAGAAYMNSLLPRR